LVWIVGLWLPGGRKKEGQPCDAQKYDRRQERLKIFFSFGKIFIVHCKKGKRFSRAGMSLTKLSLAGYTIIVHIITGHGEFGL
jgi:hypothetical protein